MKKKSPKLKKKPSPKTDKIQLIQEDENQLLELSPIVESAPNKNVNTRFSTFEEENLLEIPEFFTTAPSVPEMTKPAVETSNFEATNGTSVSEPSFESRFDIVESEIASEEIEESKFGAQTEDAQEIQPEIESEIAEASEPATVIENVEEIQPQAQLEETEEIQPQLQTIEEVDEVRPETQIADTQENQPEVQKVNDIQPEKSAETEFQTPAVPETVGETARKSGLAYGAALTLFGSVIFMLVLGYFADRIFGSSPWGIIIGIVLGAAIGFYQFFRITSQIFKNKS